MKSSGSNIKLNSYDDLFRSDDSRDDAVRERIMEIPLEELHPFKSHPFKVLDDDRMAETADSIREHGVLVPAIARPREDGGYELIAGHRRKRGCELAGHTTMPVIVRDLGDDEATIIMVDSNIQRESILPSERAFAYKMKLDALKRQGARTDLTLSQVGTKLRADEVIADQSGSSRNQVQRFIRLTELISPLLDMVDDRKIAFNPAVELSYLKPDEQKTLLDAMESEQATPSLSQAQRLKKFSKEGRLSFDVMVYPVDSDDVEEPDEPEAPEMPDEPVDEPDDDPVEEIEALYKVYRCKESITLRKKASTSSESIAQIPLGATVLVLDTTGKLYKAKYDGLTGYVNKKYVKEIPEANVRKVVKCSSYISLREEPNSSSVRLKKLPLGTLVEYIAAADNGYCDVRFENTTGYALTKYLKKPE